LILYLSLRGLALYALASLTHPLPGHDPVRLPGEAKGAAVAQRRENGLALNPALRRDLKSLAEDYGLDNPFGAA